MSPQLWCDSPTQRHTGHNGERVCGACDRLCEFERPDPCLGMLPGVIAACCGHGEQDGYLWFENGVSLRFRMAGVRWRLP